MEEIFTLIDLQSNETLINTQTYHCEGKVFKGRLDYEGGVLLNQMYAEDYRALRSAMSDGPKDGDGLSEVIATLDSEAIIYTILTPKWR